MSLKGTNLANDKDEKLEKWMIYLFWGMTPFIKLLSILKITEILPSGTLGALYYAVIFVSLFYAIRRKKIDFALIVIYLLIVIAIIISLLSLENTSYLINRVTNNDFFLMFLPALYIYRFCHSPSKMLYWSYQVGLFNVSITSISYFYSLNYTPDGDSYMTFAYSILFPWCFILYRAFIKKNIILYLLSAFLMFVMIIYGSRGVILCIAAFILYLTVLYTNNVRKKFISILTIIIAAVLLWLNMNSIINMLVSLSGLAGYESRTLSLLLSKQINYDSGRNIIYNTIWGNFASNPFIIRGIGSDELLLGINGMYSHNVFLELLHAFGIVISIPLIVYYLYIGYKMLLSKAETEWKSLFAIFYVAGFPLILLSGNLLNSYSILISLSVYLAYNKRSTIINQGEIRAEKK